MALVKMCIQLLELKMVLNDFVIIIIILFNFRELNDMVQAHQKQIVAWEEDRQRVSNISECLKMPVCSIPHQQESFLKATAVVLTVVSWLKRKSYPKYISLLSYWAY